MALHIAAAKMTSDDTPHTATLTGVTDGWESWQVSRLPHRTLGRNEAITAMMLAEMCADHVEPGSVRWVHVAGWAGELGLAAGDAVRLASEPPADAAR